MAVIRDTNDFSFAAALLAFVGVLLLPLTLILWLVAELRASQTCKRRASVADSGATGSASNSTKEQDQKKRASKMAGRLTPLRILMDDKLVQSTTFRIMAIPLALTLWLLCLVTLILEEGRSTQLFWRPMFTLLAFAVLFAMTAGVYASPHLRLSKHFFQRLLSALQVRIRYNYHTGMFRAVDSPERGLTPTTPWLEEKATAIALQEVAPDAAAKQPAATAGAGGGSASSMTATRSFMQRHSMSVLELMKLIGAAEQDAASTYILKVPM